jgi:hypothetical protein
MALQPALPLPYPVFSGSNRPVPGAHLVGHPGGHPRRPVTQPADLSHCRPHNWAHQPCSPCSSTPSHSSPLPPPLASVSFRVPLPYELRAPLPACVLVHLYALATVLCAGSCPESFPSPGLLSTAPFPLGTPQTSTSHLVGVSLVPGMAPGTQ